MGLLSIEQKLQMSAQILETACRIYAPKDTGNLSINAIRTVYENGIWQVVIGGEVAPYAIYTNEVGVKRHNKNAGWIQKAIESVRSYLINIYTDKYTVEEITAYQSKLTDIANQSIIDRMRGTL